MKLWVCLLLTVGVQLLAWVVLQLVIPFYAATGASWARHFEGGGTYFGVAYPAWLYWLQVSALFWAFISALLVWEACRYG